MKPQNLETTICSRSYSKPERKEKKLFKYRIQYNIETRNSPTCVNISRVNFQLELLLTDLLAFKLTFNVWKKIKKIKREINISRFEFVLCELKVVSKPFKEVYKGILCI